MGERVLLAEGREAEVYLQPDGSVLKLMRRATDTALVQREAAVCRLPKGNGQPAPTVHDIVTVDQRPGLGSRSCGDTQRVGGRVAAPKHIGTRGLCPVVAGFSGTLTATCWR